MDRMYAPWRLAYVKGVEDDDRVPAPSGCIFCDYVLPRRAALPPGAPEPNRRAFDERRLVVTVRDHASVILNRFPYGNGHVLVVPHAHVEHVDELDEATFLGTQRLLRETVAAIRQVYKPDGLNVGMNVGAAAGAGIASPHSCEPQTKTAEQAVGPGPGGLSMSWKDRRFSTSFGHLTPRRRSPKPPRSAFPKPVPHPGRHPSRQGEMDGRATCHRISTCRRGRA
jgi:diadenosine tetraphosphate (Ap4A) HIT family hydrolase